MDFYDFLVWKSSFIFGKSMDSILSRMELGINLYGN